MVFRSDIELKKKLNKLLALLRKEPNNDDLHYRTGNCYSDFKDYDKALSHFYSAMEINPKLAKHWLAIGETHLNKGRNKKALDYLLGAEKRDPLNAELLCLLGTAYFRLDQLEKAKWYYYESLEREPERLATLESLAYFYEKISEFPKAIMFYQEVVKKKPSKIVLQKLGDIYLKVNNKTEAEKCFKNAEEF
ncbi:MAG: tetratricopeptide repeat protein [Candidatus Heimdallarchaeota archaeon]